MCRHLKNRSLSITGFLDCIHRWEFRILENITLRNLDLFPSSSLQVFRSSLLGALERASLIHWTVILNSAMLFAHRGVSSGISDVTYEMVEYRISLVTKTYSAWGLGRTPHPDWKQRAHLLKQSRVHLSLLICSASREFLWWVLRINNQLPCQLIISLEAMKVVAHDVT
jgi:hypothetical protein